MSTSSELIKSYISTPIGKLVIGLNNKGLKYCLWDFEESTFTELANAPINQKHPLLEITKNQIQEYFQTKRTKFEIPLNLVGTDFQLKAWKSLLDIPYGQTWNYTQQAQSLNSKAVRAVGSANAKNPICLIIPCHRVTRSDGTLGGYAGGIEIKEKLLRFEKGELQF